MDFRLILVACALTLRAPFCDGAGWTYGGTHGVQHWGDEFMTCKGDRQSPINLDNHVASLDETLTPFHFEGFEPGTLTWNIVNNGHTVQINFVSGNAVVSGGGLPDTYKVAQLHFHWGSDEAQGSEHTLDGKAYPMEMHIVTYKMAYESVGSALTHGDGLAVLGFFFEVGSTTNTIFDEIVNALPKVHSVAEDASTMGPFNLLDLMSETEDYYRYLGGLTTPPCSEVVIWTVFRQPIKATNEQIAAFRNLASSEAASMTNNYRPPQDLSGRKLTTSFLPETSSASGQLGCASLVLPLVAALVVVSHREIVDFLTLFSVL